MDAVIRPEMLDKITPEIARRTVRFIVDRPRYLLIEINRKTTDGRRWPTFTLYFMIDHIAENKPAAGDKSVRVMAAGAHSPSGICNT